MASRRRWEEHGELSIVIEWDGAQYIARCREYDLKATGKTLREARESLLDMIQHYRSLTDVQAWNDFFARVQEELDQDTHNTWASGEHTVN